MKKLVLTGLFIAAVFVFAGSAESKQFASLNEKIQAVQNSISPMLDKLQASIHAQIKSSSAATQKNIAGVQSQITQLQSDTNAKIEAQSKSNMKSIEKVRSDLQTLVGQVQAQVVTLQESTDKKLAELNKSIESGAQ